MTNLELRTELEKFPDDLEVRYEYDGGHSYPTFVRVYLNSPSEYKEEFICLNENFD